MADLRERRSDDGCTLCIDAPEMEFDYCRACGRGATTYPVAAQAGGSPLFNGIGCGHPPDPVAVRGSLGHVCHCGTALPERDAVACEGAPGPVAMCQNCGCHVALIDTATPEGEQ